MRRIENDIGQQLIWFRSLEEVEGVHWERPLDLQMDQSLTAATPRFERFREDPPEYRVRWVGGDGRCLPDDFNSYESPASHASSNLFDLTRTDAIAKLVSQVLALPGTQHDYYSGLTEAIGALQRMDASDELRFTTMEHLAFLAIDLLDLDLEGSITPTYLPGIEHTFEELLPSASQPYSTLIDLYVAEGFLREAAEIQGQLDSMPSGTRPRWFVETDPAGTLEALIELADNEGAES